MADERDGETERELMRAAEDVDYWYQVAQSLCMQLVREHLPVDAVRALVAKVEMDAACEFEALHEGRRYIIDFVTLELFEGLRTIRDEQRKRQGEG